MKNLESVFLEAIDSGDKFDNVEQSTVAWLIGITDIKPSSYPKNLKVDWGRMDFPDIDMDFETSGRDEMKTYMEEKYGERLSLCTYSSFKSKSLVASICKALGMTEAQVRATTKHFDSLDEYESSSQLVSFRAKNPEILPIARELEGRISGTGMHPSAVVIADRPLHTIVPVESRVDPEDKTKRVPVSAFDMTDAEEVGLIKFDFLGLNNLDVIHDCVDSVKERHGVDIDWENLSEDDPDVLAMLDEQNTVGVFQMESSQYRNLISEQGIHNFNDMAASNALVRPGAYETIAKNYIKRKKGTETVTYPHDDMIPWLEDTYGLIVYQEQLMMASVIIGGFTQGEAEKLRKIIGKKRDVTEFAVYEDKWMENAGAKIGEKAAKKLWHDFEKHAGYSFNASHAFAYSYISYVTAWLKFHYPIEYIYALLKNEKSAMTKMTYILEAKRLGIEILRPDVNASSIDMVIEDGALRFGLGDIKGVGEAAAQHILDKGPFDTWDEWETRIVKQKCNKARVESLIAVDAFCSVEGAPREKDPESNFMEYLNYPIDLENVAELGIKYDPIDQYEEGSKGFMVVCGVVKAVKRTATWLRLELEDMSGKMTCFGSMDNDLKEGEVVLALVGEKTMLGYARVDGLKVRLTNGTADFFEKLMVGKAFDDIKGLYELGIGKMDDLKSLVIPLSVRRITTKKGKKMAFSYITDGEQVIKLTIFPQSWEALEGKITAGNPICVKLKYLDDGGRTVNEDGVVDATWLYEKNKDKI